MMRSAWSRLRMLGRGCRGVYRWLRYGEVDIGSIVGVPYGPGPAMIEAAAVGVMVQEQRERLDVALRHLEVVRTHLAAAREALGP